MAVLKLLHGKPISLGLNKLNKLFCLWTKTENNGILIVYCRGKIGYLNMKEVLFNKIQRLREETKYLVDNKPKFLRTLKSSIETKKIVERSVYLCAEIVLDIADLVLIKKGYPKSSSYSDSIYKLGNYGLIPKDFAEKFAYIAGLRNFLAHDYQINTIPELEKFLKYGLKDLKDFIKSVDRLL